MKLTKQRALRAVIEAHEDERRKSAECAETFKNSKTFPDASGEELKKISRIDIALDKLRSFSTSADQSRTEVYEGALLRASNSHRGEEFYFFLKESVCPFVEIREGDSKIDLLIVDSTKFRPSRVGQTEIYFLGRPGEEFEIRLTAIEIL